MILKDDRSRTYEVLGLGTDDAGLMDFLRACHREGMNNPPASGMGNETCGSPASDPADRWPSHPVHKPWQSETVRSAALR